MPRYKKEKQVTHERFEVQPENLHGLCQGASVLVGLQTRAVVTSTTNELPKRVRQNEGYVGTFQLA